ncbi:MAG: phosphate/phosphite/phosphonate ABC transporter substrate-binding protein [Nitrospirae bacterium]|nr:phosphate/phosphite/phosphonate ABC transporter substrate-binding protein [Nitrospirota bacterium]
MNIRSAVSKGAWVLVGGIALTAGFLAVESWWSAREGSRPFDIRTGSDNVLKADSPVHPLRIAIAPVLSVNRTIEGYQSIADYLSYRLAGPVRLVQRKTYGEVNELLRHGTVQAAIICTGAYIQAQADRVPLDAIAVPIYTDGPVYYSFIIVRAEDAARTMTDLKGRSFAFSDPLSLSGHYYALSMLLDRGVNPGEYFSGTTFTYSHDGSIKAVVDGIADGAAVDSLVYDYEVRHNPALARSLRIVHRSPPFGSSPVVVPRALEPPLRAHLQKAFLNMADSKLGRDTLDSLAIRRFEAPPPGLYDSAENIIRKVDRYLQGHR